MIELNYNKTRGKYNEKPTRNLTGDFWVISTFYNPLNLKNKKIHYNFFRNNLKRQGLKLLTVECSFNNQSFGLKPEEADILLQVRSNSIMWQKERLLNVALNNLPSSCDKVAWLDSDIVILDDNWSEKVALLLKRYDFVKPFTKAKCLNKKETNKILKGSPLKDLDLTGKYDYSLEKSDLVNFLAVFGLCARYQRIKEIGFYDKMIIYGGDIIMANAFLKKTAYPIPLLSPALIKDIYSWQKLVNNSLPDLKIGYLEADLIHFFHGRFFHRRYSDGLKFMKKYDFNPSKDLIINSDGCFEWFSDKSDFQRFLINYFKSRNEEDDFLKNIYLFVLAFFRSFYELFDKMLGFIGQKLKVIFPRLYYFLKKYF